MRNVKQTARGLLLLMLCPLLIRAQASDREVLTVELEFLRQRTDSLWGYGTDPAPIIVGIERIQKAACQAGFHDLYVLGFCDLAEVYATTDMEEQYKFHVELGWGQAQALLTKDDPVLAVAAASLGHYLWNNEESLVDSVYPLIHNAVPVLMETDYPRALFWGQLDLAEYNHHGFGNPLKTKPWLEAAEHTLKDHLPAKSLMQVGLDHLKGNCLGDSGEMEEAILILKRSIDLFESQVKMSRPDSVLLVAFYRNIAHHYFRNGQMDLAGQFQSRSISVGENLSFLRRVDSTALIRTYNDQAFMFANKGYVDSAIQAQNRCIYLTESLSVLSQSDSADLAYYYTNLAGKYSDNGQIDSAIATQLKCIAIIKMLAQPNPLSVAFYNNNLAFFYQQAGNYQLSLQLRLYSLSLLEQLPVPNPWVKGRFMYDIGTLYFYLESFAQAKEMVTQAQFLLKNPPTFHNAAYYVKALLADCLLPDSLTQAAEVKEKISEAFGVAKQWNLNLEEVHYGKGAWERKVQNYPAALAEFRQSLNQLQKISFFGYDGYRRLFKAMGDIHLTCAQYDSAYHNFHLALLNCSKETTLKSSPVNPNIHQLKNNQHLIETLSNKALAQFAMGQERRSDSLLRESFATYQLGEAAAQRQRTNYSGKISRLSVSRDAVNLYAGSIRTALALYASTDSTHYLESAFASAEKAKGQTLLQSQWEAEATGQGYLPPEVVEERRNHLVNLSSVEEKIRKFQIKDTLRAAQLQSRAFEIQEDLKEWEEGVAKDFPEYQQRLTQDFDIDIAALQGNQLEEGEALIEYFISRAETFGSTKIGKDELFTFVITQDTLMYYRQLLSKDFDLSLSQLIRSLSDYAYVHDSVAQSYASYTQSAQLVYHWLLKPALEDHPNLKKLIIATDGPLSQIPFEALLTTSAPKNRVDYTTLPYLINNYELQYTYSAQLLQETGERSSYDGLKACLALAPNSPGNTQLPTRGDLEQLRNSEGAPLPGTFTEVQALAGLGFEGDFLFGEAATEKRFKESADQYSVLYLAQHGYAAPEDPVMSYLRFTPSEDSAEDGLFHSYELEAMRLKADLVVLSACETGIGTYLPGEGIASLGSAFLASGVSMVVMTLWRVEDRASNDLMEFFFQHLANDDEVATALHKAKLDFIAHADSRTAHPFYWSAYVANGDSRPVTFSAGMPPIALFGWGALSLALVAGAGWFYRRRRQRQRA